MCKLVRSVRVIVATPLRVFWLASATLFLAGLAGPVVVLNLINDGGFGRYGWNIDLTSWNEISVERGTSPIVHADLVSVDEGGVHKEFWINTGQSVTFIQVPATIATQFVSAVRVHPNWNPETSIKPLNFRVTIDDGKRQAISNLVVQGPRATAGEWQRIAIDLAPFAGQRVSIRLAPVAQSTGVWTLWRDAAIVGRP